VVRYGDDESSLTRILPVDGSPGRELTSGRFSFVDVQRLAPWTQPGADGILRRPATLGVASCPGRWNESPPPAHLDP